MSCCAIAKCTWLMSCLNAFCGIFQLAVISPTACITGNSVADRVWRVKRLLPLWTTNFESFKFKDTGPSGSARKISSSLRAATVVVISPSPTPKLALVAIWISISVDTNETRSPVFLNNRLANMGSVCRRSTMPLTIWSGFNKLSRDVFISCIAFKSLYISN